MKQSIDGCRHTHVVYVEEKPKERKDIFLGSNKTYFKCYRCGIVLPIQIITKEEIIVPFTY